MRKSFTEAGFSFHLCRCCHHHQHNISIVNATNPETSFVPPCDSCGNEGEDPWNVKYTVTLRGIKLVSWSSVHAATAAAAAASSATSVAVTSIASSQLLPQQSSIITTYQKQQQSLSPPPQPPSPQSASPGRAMHIYLFRLILYSLLFYVATKQQ